jgi:hypothetical protein
MWHLQLTCCSLCQLTWTAGKDPAYSVGIFIRHTWMPYTFLVQTISGLFKLFVPSTYRWSWQWCLVICCSETSLNLCILFCFDKAPCTVPSPVGLWWLSWSYAQMNGVQWKAKGATIYWELSEALSVSIKGDWHLVCLTSFHKLSFMSIVVNIIYTHSICINKLFAYMCRIFWHRCIMVYKDV